MTIIIENGDWSYFQVVNGIEHALLKGYAGILISRGAKVVRGTRA